MGPIPAVVVVLLIGGVVSQESRCPKGQPEVNCLVDPCTYTDCAPGHRCQSNYCGGCNAECISTCPKVMCALYCKSGFKRGKDGCEICQCRDPCETMRCSSGYVCRNGQCIRDQCTHNGQNYALGARFPRGDGCNTCVCQPGNNVACTEVYCPHCEYNGFIYQPGDNFNSTDGCNTCRCSDNGQVACTKKACPPGPPCTYNSKTYYPGQTFDSCRKTGILMLARKRDSDLLMGCFYFVNKGLTQ